MNRSRRDVLIMIGSALALVGCLWLLAIPLSWAPDPIGPAAEQFAEGARITVSLTLIAGVSGLLLGLLAGLAKRSPLRWLRWPAEVYIWVFRGTPLLTQILFAYLVLPELGLQLPEFGAAVVALALNVGAYNAEVIRGGLDAVPPGQIEAARSLGMSRTWTFFDVVLPQSLRIALPGLANNVVSLLKDSSLAYAIGVVELNMVAQRVQSTSFQPVPVFITTAAVYLVLTTALTHFTAALERRLDTPRR